ncbi:unnamed protein product [Prorocentrum cordatum]|uniref:Uncharacterized protein n=1 Tax=Prorocentrum cordatum TaxID=2364126 RepID=A0ABN9SXK6_9DINO|nr:unnamed protein product [Polarella glacialis]
MALATLPLLAVVSNAQDWHQFATVQARGASMNLGTTADLADVLDHFLSTSGKVEEELLRKAEVMSEELTKDAIETQSLKKQAQTALVQELHARHELMAERSRRLAVAINGKVGHGKCCCSGDSLSAAAGDLNCSWVTPAELGDVTGRCPSDTHLLAATWTAGYGGDQGLLARGLDSCAASEGWKDADSSMNRPLAGVSDVSVGAKRAPRIIDGGGAARWAETGGGPRGGVTLGPLQASAISEFAIPSEPKRMGSTSFVLRSPWVPEDDAAAEEAAAEEAAKLRKERLASLYARQRSLRRRAVRRREAAVDEECSPRRRWQGCLLMRGR